MRHLVAAFCVGQGAGHGRGQRIDLHRSVDRQKWERDEVSKLKSSEGVGGVEQSSRHSHSRARS